MFEVFGVEFVWWSKWYALYGDGVVVAQCALQVADRV
jgi:hypothetical protein